MKREYLPQHRCRLQVFELTVHAYVQHSRHVPATGTYRQLSNVICRFEDDQVTNVWALLCSVRTHPRLPVLKNYYNKNYYRDYYCHFSLLFLQPSTFFAHLLLRSDNCVCRVVKQYLREFINGIHRVICNDYCKELLFIRRIMTGYFHNDYNGEMVL